MDEEKRSSYPKVALIWPAFYFYHVARFQALHRRLGERLLGIELVGGALEDRGIRWQYLKRGDLPIVTLFPRSDIGDIAHKDLGASIINKLRDWGADAIFVNGYYTPEYRLVINWAHRHNKRCFIFSETKRNDYPRFFGKEWLKRRIIKRIDGAICGGRLHRDYLVELGLSPERILFGYDAVDNDFFRRMSSLARSDAEANRRKYNLPQRYFFSACRFVKKKNLIRLLDAYKIYSGKAPADSTWSLVLCGAGPEENKLKRKVRIEGIKGVHFLGAAQPEELAVYYALASCFILASTQEQWGLVVNEAMASSLPVLVTNVAGAAGELVENGINGYTFTSRDKGELAGLMLEIAGLDSARLREMGAKSEEKIRVYTPQLFAESIIRLLSL
ncbi:MAG: glycosyltransferase family 4 protein [Candidatus Omnitrophota bacterium]|jgi:glycosyltransferase involved in cell wall biosynthesis